MSAESNMPPSAATQLEGDAIPGLTPPQKARMSPKALIALGFVVVSLGAVSVLLGKRYLDNRKAAEPEKAQEVASATAHRLKLGDPKDGTLPRFQGQPASTPAPPAPPAPADKVRVPAIAEPPGQATPIDVVRRGEPRSAGATAPARGGSGPATAAPMNPMDAPVFSSQSRQTAARGRTGKAGAGPAAEVPADEEAQASSLSSTMAEVRAHKERLEAELKRRTGAAGAAATQERIAENQAAVAARFGPPIVSDGSGRTSGGSRLLGGGVDYGTTEKVAAQRPFSRSLTVAKGTIFHCALQTRVVTATSGFVNCLLQRDVYGHDGKVVLAERGSSLVGEYRMTAVKPGLTRIPVVWTRLLTPHAVSVELESPAIGQLGESGIVGHVDNRWPERIGAALLVSMIDDVLTLATQRRDGDSETVLLPNTSSQGNKMAEEVLKSTINIPPLLYQNQGSLVGVYVARDLDFSHVYKLQAE